jgi:GNAT superfamily N-acetyltransferase
MRSKPVSGEKSGRRHEMYPIRAGTEGDIPTLAGIERAADRLFPEGRLPIDGGTYPASAFSRALSEGLLLVADVGGAVSGFAVAEPVGQAFHLHLLAVHPDHGRRGIGRALVLRVIEEASRRDLASVTLTTFQDLPWNAPFYQTLGFRILPQTKQSRMLKATLEEERASGMSMRVAMEREEED